MRSCPLLEVWFLLPCSVCNEFENNGCVHKVRLCNLALLCDAVVLSCC